MANGVAVAAHESTFELNSIISYGRRKTFSSSVSSVSIPILLFIMLIFIEIRPSIIPFYHISVGKESFFLLKKIGSFPTRPFYLRLLLSPLLLLLLLLPLPLLLLPLLLLVCSNFLSKRRP